MDFVGNWSTGQDSFAVDVSNAVLLVYEHEGVQDVVIIELFVPVYDFESLKILYNSR